jgi:hypothetical protein
MINLRKKEIDLLRKKIAKLEAQVAREAEIRDTVSKIYKDLKSQISKAGVTLEEVIRAHHRDFLRIMDRIHKSDQEAASIKPKKSRKKAKKAARKAKKATIKIPAGKYSNIPPDEKMVFEVKPRGPRPKILKAHAEKLGLEKFLKECKK